MSTPESLAGRLAADLDATFPSVVDHFSNSLYSTALRLTRSPQDAEDLTQETLVRAYRALRTYEGDRIRELALRGWLWTILLNLVRNRARSRSRKPPPHDLDAAPPQRSRVDTAAAAAAAVDLHDALRALRPIEREVIVLRYVADLGFEEISAATGSPVGTVKSHAHRSLKRLRQILGEEQP